MRIISGLARGLKLKAPKGMQTRPTADKVKGALFNIIMERVPNSTWIDLFAGSGAIGIEALSRGAKSVLFVEKATTAVKIINENLKETKLEGGRVIKQDVFKFLHNENMDFGYDLIFIDPPYETLDHKKILELIDENKWLKVSGLIILESSKEEVIPDRAGELVLYRTKQYGSTILNFFKYSC